jgi:hypothetical protein
MTNGIKDVDPATLRDTLLIWVFATANEERLNAIINNTMSADQLRTMLEDTNSIRKNNADNIGMCDALCKAIQNPNNTNNFSNIQRVLNKMPTLAQIWSVGPNHPRDVELNKAFISISPA